MNKLNFEKHQELFDSPLGQSMWNKLNSEEGIHILKATTATGQYAEKAVFPLFNSEWKDQIENPEVYELITKMVQHVMLRLGYDLIERTTGYYRHELIFLSRYLQLEKKLTALEILKIGKSALFQSHLDWMKHKDINRSIFDIYFKDSKPRVVITGKAVFEDFDVLACEPAIDIDVFVPGSPLTILSKLSTGEIYLRIKNFYTWILAEYEGRLVSGKMAHRHSVGNQNPILKGLITGSVSAIQNMPLYPTPVYLKELSEEILYGSLSYACNHSDEYNVPMGLYAKTLQKR